GLAPRGDILVPDCRGDGIAPAQSPRQAGESGVLRPLVRELVGAFQLHADREVVAVLAPAPARDAGVPRAQCAGNELDQDAVAADQEMRRDAKPGDARVIWMSGGIEAIREESDDGGAAEPSRWHRDVVDDQQRYGRVSRTRIAIRRRYLPRGADRSGAVDVEPWTRGRQPVRSGEGGRHHSKPVRLEFHSSGRFRTAGGSGESDDLGAGIVTCAGGPSRLALCLSPPSFPSS